MNSKYLASLTLMAAFLIGGCIGSGKAPLESLTYVATPEKNNNLIVFLRGMGGTLNCPISGHKCFETEGFVEAVKKKGLPYDMIAPNAHFLYYENRTLDERLTEDVIQPARAGGYDKIWLVGVSMGGLGSLLYLKEHPENIDGILTLGPKLDANFVGNGAIIDEIAVAGGVDNWEPGNYDPEEDWPRMLWDWLKKYNHDGVDAPPIYLGVGTEDGFFKAQNLLASDLPQDRVIFVEGGHRFSTFKKIWDIFLDRQILQ